MKKEELKLIIKEGEGLAVEFKEKYSSHIDKDMVAFANTKGGKILLGVNDDGKIIGEKLTNRMKAEITNLSRNCDPSINIIRISQLDRIVLIEIPEGEEKPYSCSLGYYRRLNGVTQKMNQREIRLFFQDMNVMPFEEQICRNII